MSAIGIMGLFIILFWLASLEIVRKRRSASIIVIFVVALFCFLIEKRGDNVPDTIAYRNLFVSLKTDSFILFKERKNYLMEWGFLIFCQIIKKLFGEGVSALWIGAALCSTGFSYMAVIELEKGEIISGRKKNMNFLPCLFFLCYISYFGLFYNAIVVRTGIALSLAFLSAAFINNRKWKRGIIIFICASLFHRSVFILLPAFVFLLADIKIKRSMYQILWCIYFVLFAVNIGYLLLQLMLKVMLFIGNTFSFMEHFLYYKDDIVPEGLYSKKNILFLFMGLFFSFGDLKSKTYRKCLNIYYIGLGVLLFLGNWLIGYRIIDLYLFFSIPLLYLFFKNINLKKQKGDILVFYGFIVMELIAVLRVIGLN